MCDSNQQGLARDIQIEKPSFRFVRGLCKWAIAFLFATSVVLVEPIKIPPLRNQFHALIKRAKERRVASKKPMHTDFGHFDTIWTYPGDNPTGSLPTLPLRL